MIGGGGGRRRLFFRGELFLPSLTLLWLVINYYLVHNLIRFTTTPLLSEPDEINDKAKDGISPRQSSKISSSSHIYTFDRELAELALAQYGREAIFQPLRAYIEKKMNDTVPNTIDRGNLDEPRPKIEVGMPAKFYVPLPLREGSPEDVSRIHSHLSITNQLRHVSSYISMRLEFSSVSSSYFCAKSATQI